MTVPYAFANLSGNIALAKLDSNFNTPITIGNTSVLLGNTVTTLNNLTLANVTITSGTSNVTNVNVTNVTVTNLTATLANVTTLNVASAYITSANIGTLALTNALPVSSGGTGQVTFPANSVLLGNGTGGIATVSPGNVGNVLTSIGGVWVSNVALSGAAAGANTQVQYNNSGALGASANLTFNGTTLTANTLNLTNALGTTYGGTGLTSFTANGVVYASSSSALATGSALTFDGSNLGVGVTPSAWNSAAKAIQISTAATFWGISNNQAYVGSNSFYDSGGNFKYIVTDNATQYRQWQGAHTWFNAPSGTAGNAITFTQAMTLDASGNLLVGTTTASSSITNGFTVTGPAAVTALGIGHVTGSGPGTNYVVFNYNGSAIGSITQNSTTGVLYNITSDQRLKENIQDAEPASDLIDAIQVRQFDWKFDGSHQRYGFVAQELVTVAPEAVNQPPDSDEMMAVDYSKLVPMLVKEIQSLRIRIAQLEAK